MIAKRGRYGVWGNEFVVILKKVLKPKTAALETLIEPIAEASEGLAQSLLQGKKNSICGNGGSAADAQHFSAELINLLRPSAHPCPLLPLQR